MAKSIAKKSTTGSLPPAVPLAFTPTFSPWTHTSDDSYIYQLSLVLATATLYLFWHPMLVRPVMKSLFFPWSPCKTKEKKARFARAPHDKRVISCVIGILPHLGIPLFYSFTVFFVVLALTSRAAFFLCFRTRYASTLFVYLDSVAFFFVFLFIV